MILEGSLSVKAAMLAGRRKVTKLYVDRNKDDKDTAFILKTASRRHIPVVRTGREEIDELASGRTHGGIIAEAGERRLQTLRESFTDEKPFFVLAEGVEDPFNLGYMMRTLYSAGCTGLLLKARSWENADATILKSSAGASEYLNVIMSEDLPKDLRWLKSRGVHLYAAMRKDAVVYTAADYTGPVLLAVGGEMRGLSAGVRAEIEDNIFIPYANDFRAALNAASATAVLAYEVVRQRREEL
ncbi:MAG: RNA methyltransferase [Solobacterium sp.]|nr:RNA methyltransferase [Solobacterium sp.]